jgi:hypothetical protein
LVECNEFIENTQEELVKFARRAFEINRQALTAGNITNLGKFLSSLMIGLIAKLNISGYNHFKLSSTCLR